MKLPDPNAIHPIAGYENEINIKPTVKNPNIIVGDFSYIADADFERHVTHHYEWIGDKLIIGKFCQIAAGNPAKRIRQRFDDEMIKLLLQWKWWDKSIEEIKALIPLLTNGDLEQVKEQIKSILQK